MTQWKQSANLQVLGQPGLHRRHQHPVPNANTKNLHGTQDGQVCLNTLRFEIPIRPAFGLAKGIIAAVRRQ